MTRRVAALAVLAALTSGCTTTSQDVPPIGTGLSTPPPIDADLRPVSLPFGDGLPYVAAETSAQAICQAVPKPEWEELLGEPVGRTIVEGITCVVTGADVTVRLRMMIRELAPERGTEVVTIAGHQVRIGNGEAAAALLPVGDQDMDAQLNSRTLPVFYVEGPDEKLRELVAALLPVLVHDGPPVPAPDAAGAVPFTPTAPLPGTRLVDLPAPVQALVLCTAIGATPVHVTHGLCQAGDTVASVLPEFRMGEETQRVAGHRATVDGDAVYVELNPPDRGVLKVRGDLAFAEQLLGRLGDL